MNHIYHTIILALFASTSLLMAAGGGGTVPMPDFTKGDPVPAGYTHDWNLGPTGLRGWIYSDTLVTTDARQILITKVQPASPGDGKFANGDVILGVGGKPFSHDPRSEFGKAVTAAEITGKLALTRWRAGTVEELSLEIPVLGAYGKTAPYDCPKSARIFEAGCKALAKRMEHSDYAKDPNAMTRSINALALLASGKEEYMPLIRREVEWANGFSAGSMPTWWNSFVIMLLAEYKIATGDGSFTSGMSRLAIDAAKGQSMVGSWGHGYAIPSGNLGGYGMMNVTGIPLTIGLIMAREAGIKDPAVDLAIERSSRLLCFYIGKGSVPYGDHHPWTENHDDNGKNGMAGVMFNLLGEKEGAEYFSRMSVATHGAERDCGHCGNFTNLLWAVPGVALSGPKATGAWMNEFGARYFDLTRTSDFRFPHPGPPQAKGDSYNNWDATGCYLLAYAMPLKKILLTGKRPNLAPQIDAATASSLIDDGRGWSNKDRNSAYDKLDPDTLLEKLCSWSPTVRERSAMAIMRRKGDKPVATLVEMLDSPNLHARYGACEALIRLGGSAAPAVPKLTALIAHEDLWMRVKAAETLSHIGSPAMSTLPLLLKRLTLSPSKSDPRGMEQRYLCFSVFGRLLKKPQEGIDRDLLRQAVAAGLRNEDGRARSSIAEIYKMLSYEEIKPLLPAIYNAAVKPAPSGEMFADGIRVAGLEILAAHHVAEGIPACMEYLATQNPWASEKRTPMILKSIVAYGANAKTAIPALKEMADLFAKGEKDFPKHLSESKAADVRKAITDIESSTHNPELRHIR